MRRGFAISGRCGGRADRAFRGCTCSRALPAAVRMSGPHFGVAGVVPAGDRVAVVLRGRPPAVDTWAFPGGGLRLGEPIRDAVAREVREETGLLVRARELLDVIEVVEGRPGQLQHWVVAAYAAEILQDTTERHLRTEGCSVRPREGERRAPQGEPAPLVPGDDALDARWVTLRELAARRRAPGTLALARRVLAS